MRKYGIFDTSFAKSASYKKQVIEALKFVTENPMACFADEDLKNFIMTKTFSSFNTPMSQIFNHLINSYKSKNELPFVELYINAKNPPEIFTYDSFTFRFDDIQERLPEKLKGVVVNLTNTVRSKPSAAGKIYSTDDLTKLHSLYVRAALCQSYSNSSDRLWLSPKLALFVIRTYSMILTKQVSVHYHITDPLMLKKINFINTIFYANLIDKEVESGISELIYRSGIGNYVEIKDMINELSDLGFKFEKRYTSHDVCEMYKAIGGDILSNFNFVKMFKLFSAGSSDHSYSGISMEYPPYWIHQLLLLGSGGKHPVYSTIFRDSGVMKEIIGFAHELNTTPAFIGSLG